MDEVHNRSIEFCIRQEARCRSQDSVFDPTQENDKRRCLVCGMEYGKERPNNHRRKHCKDIPAHMNTRPSCQSCEDFKTIEKENGLKPTWTFSDASMPSHVEACDRERAECLTCPACLLKPIKWSK